MLHFEWDEAKADANLRNHGISFGFARTAFNDAFAIEWLDDRKDYGELRFILIGMAEKYTLLYVAYTERNECIRIISARRVTQHEQAEYIRQNA